MLPGNRPVARRYGPVAVGVFILALVATACGPGATPQPTPSPTPVATPTPSPTPSPSPSPTPLPDPSEGLAIAAPYTLNPLPPALAAGMEAAMKSAMGSLSSVVQVGARTADQGGVTQSYVIVMRIPGVPTSNPTFLDGVAVGVAGTSGTSAKQTILGHDVRVVTSPTAVNVAFVIGDRVILVAGATTTIEIAVATAIIQANP